MPSSTYGADPYAMQANTSSYPQGAYPMQSESGNKPTPVNQQVMESQSYQVNEYSTAPQQKGESQIIQLNSLDPVKQEEMNERTFGGVDIKQEFMDLLMKLVF